MAQDRQCDVPIETNAAKGKPTASRAAGRAAIIHNRMGAYGDLAKRREDL
jgi:hypothetical protein